VSLPFLDWLPKQRWYAGRARTLVSAEPAQVTEVARDLTHMLVRAVYDDGGAEIYQVWVGWDIHPAPEFHDVATIGDDGGRIGFDALYEDGAAHRILELVQSGASVDGLEFSVEPGVALPLEVTSRVLDGEQSNTSVIFDSAAIFKLFRRLVPGLNPEVELGRVLGRAHSPYVPPLLGAVDGVFPNGGPGHEEQVSLAMVTAFAPNSADGWAMAVASVRDLLAEADLHADEVGGDFAAESFRLGEAVAAVHATLAEQLGVSEGSPPLAEMNARLDEAAQVVPEVAALRAELVAGLSAAADPVPLQRVHGDLHLGQALRTPDHWLLIDFEGEPGQTMAERRRADSPLRDVAGMLRSFEYAGYQLLVGERGNAQLGYRAAEWVERNRSAFCDGYASVAGEDPREQSDLLRAYELDKAVYEAAYEVRHRPGWLWIPLQSIERMLGVR
jgi:maltokinase